MTMYQRTSNSGHIIEWDPEHEDEAVQAIIDVNGTGITDPDEARETYAEVDDDTAKRVRERYGELTPDPEPADDPDGESA